MNIEKEREIPTDKYAGSTYYDLSSLARSCGDETSVIWVYEK